MNDSTNVAENLKWLVLVPTKFEHQYVSSALQIANSVIEICGFGPVVPAARTVQLIQRHDPDRVLLIGIAGTYGGTAEVGSASSFSKVACYGIGAGSGETFQTAQEMGWNHWDDEDKNRQITDVIPIVPLNKNTSQILTVCSAAEDSADVEQRLKKFPLAVAEDMEGFGVATAGRLCDVPVSVVRGFSNQAGDRDKANWKIADALSATVKLCHGAIENAKMGQDN